MKSIEEKARAYDEALEKARQLCVYPTSKPFISDLQDLFPELKESEDERIRKALLNHLKEASRGKTLLVNTLDYKRWADWLEKQGNKDEEILILKDQIESLHAAIKAIKETHRIELEKLSKNSMGISEATKQKLEDSLNKALEKETPESCHEFLNEQDELDKESEDEKIRQFLIHEVEETSDKVMSYRNMNKKAVLAWLEKQSEQKPAWSEKDERMFKNTIALIETIEDYNKAPDGFGDVKFWLKSLKGRVLPQNFNVTDKELAQAKKDAYNDALNKIEYHSGEPTFDDGWSAAIWYLKKRNAQPQSTWKPSDEQIQALEAIIGCVHDNASWEIGTEWFGVLFKLKEQLKKLKG